MAPFQLTISLLVWGLLILQTKGQVDLEELVKSTFDRKSNVQPTRSHVQKTTEVIQTTTGHLSLGELISRAHTQNAYVQPTTPAVQSRLNCASKSCGQGKECVPKQLCLDGVINTSGVNLIDVRIDVSVCFTDEICCNLPNKRNDTVSTRIPSAKGSGCGWHNVDGIDPRIAEVDRDNEALFGEFPWMVAILRRNGDGMNDSYVCGGSLIAANVVLTANHCAVREKANQLVVRAGEWDTQNTNEIYAHVVKHVREIIRHENYRQTTLVNNVALLILEDAFTWQPNIRPICIPEPRTNFDYSRCYATGWGLDKFGQEGEYQVILKKVNLPVVPHAICQDKLRKTDLGFFYSLDESFICAGGEKDKKDTCKGDGGSPLVCPIPGSSNRYYQAGIVAFGVECGKEGVPGVYASVSHLRSWISDKLIARGITFADFTP